MFAKESRPFADIPEGAQRQYVDAVSALIAFREAQELADSVRGGMYWKRQGVYEYLVRTASDNRQSVIRRRDPEAEALKQAFEHRKVELRDRLKSLTGAVKRHEQRNRIERVGNAPLLIVRLLKAVDEAGLTAQVRVVSAHAMHAYAAKAGVRFQAQAGVTRGSDAAWVERPGLRLADLTGLGAGFFLDIARRADKTFVLRRFPQLCLRNKDGFTVDLVRLQAESSRSRKQLEADAEAAWLKEPRHADRLLRASKFEAVVVAASGAMAFMPTFEPALFVKYKRWLARQPGRDAAERERDAQQARMVAALAREFFV